VGDVGHGGFAGFAGGEVAGSLGLAWAGASWSGPDVEGRVERFQEEDRQGEVILAGGETPRPCRSRRPGRAGS
jgi:hypothetical protein